MPDQPNGTAQPSDNERDVTALLLVLRDAAEERRKQLAEPWLNDPPLTHLGLVRIIGRALKRLDDEEFQRECAEIAEIDRHE